ncbi:uncharacterized protein LOC127255297 [Andrographis paniculata]|uniref:uncharacterized protein LOC127255297 n=1 Tax=Andrographis paniculata TaxID=175694 RepID=UPI0021E782B0|nr:uncharacterized protein LOC127255297 [Andrographis paniculata]
MSLFEFITGSTRSWQPATTVDTTTVSYWINWRVLLCSIWILMPIIFASSIISRHERHCCSLGQHKHQCCGVLYEDQAWKPCLESVHPGWLLAFRVFAGFILLTMLVLNVVVDGSSIFYYYTQWTFTLVTIYFGLGSMLSMRGCYRYRSLEKEHFDAEHGSYGWTKIVDLNQERREKAGLLSRVYHIIFQISAGAVVLTDIVFWFVIVPFLATKDYKLNFLVINMHSTNAVFLLIDTALNSLTFPWFRIGYFLLWTCSYILFQWILHASVSIWWPYPFLDLSSSYAPLLYSSIALLHIPCYGIFLLIVKGKHVLLSKWYPQSYLGVQQ